MRLEIGGVPYTSKEVVPDALLEAVMDYSVAATTLSRSRQCWRIPAMVADQWLTQGYGIVETNAFASRYGTSRRTVCRHLIWLVDHGIMKHVGITESGSPRFVPVLDIGASWREKMNELDKCLDEDLVDDEV